MSFLFFCSRSSPNLNPIVQSPDHHSALYDDNMLEGEAASTPSPRTSPTPQPPPPRRSPTPLLTPPRRSPTPPPPPPTKKPSASKRPAPQTKNQSPPTKKATVKPRAIPKIISKEKGEVSDAYKKDMSRFYDKLKKNQEARRNLEKPYFFVALDILRKRVASYQPEGIQVPLI